MSPLSQAVQSWNFISTPSSLIAVMDPEQRLEGLGTSSKGFQTGHKFAQGFSVPMFRTPGSERLLEAEIPVSIPQSVAKTFHTTISEDQTDQEALEGHRLVALQQTPKLDHSWTPFPGKIPGIGPVGSV